MKPSLPQGTRDFSATVVRKRNYIFNTIRNVFELYGFQPLETPAMENMETLMGKYGEEGDKLIFKVLNNGLDNPAKHEQARNDFEKVLDGKNTKGITERALRYDLTIPFARYVAMNFGQLTLPFKRYQIQPVWRADRPQRGRYREFYQCDADVVGSNSLMNEVELLNIYLKTFERLKLNVVVKINSRKILEGIASFCGIPEKLTDITIALDKIDKIGFEKVKIELGERGIPEDKIELLIECLNINTNDLTEEMCLDCVNISKQELSVQEQRIACLKYKFWTTEVEVGMNGCDDLLFLLNYFDSSEKILFDISLARGLNYYTGSIFEVQALAIQMGSIGGGGRYDDLTGLFGVPNVPGVGISFGVDRIYDVMEELQLFPAELQTSTKVMFFNLGENESRKAYQLMQELRAKGISAEMYHEHVKLDKQFKYAEKRSIGHVVILGSKELEDGICILKNLTTGVQNNLGWKEFAESIVSLF